MSNRAASPAYTNKRCDEVQALAHRLHRQSSGASKALNVRLNNAVAAKQPTEKKLIPESQCCQRLHRDIDICHDTEFSC